MTAYLTVEAFKATLELTGTSFADHDIERELETASRALDQAYGRRFQLDDEQQDPADYTARVYTPGDSRKLWIDDVAQLVEVKLDRDGDGTFETTWTLGADFVLEPANAAADGRPYTRIETRTAELLPRCQQSVSVRARWGWPDVPSAVVSATGIVASRLLTRARSAPLGVVAVGTDSAIRLARTDPDVVELMWPYDRRLPV